jgi:hypothetical protein
MMSIDFIAGAMMAPKQQFDYWCYAVMGNGFIIFAMMFSWGAG